MSFVFVGLTGLVVNSIVLVLATTYFGFFYLISVAIASLSSTLWNFCLTELWVYRDRTEQTGLWKRFWLFLVLNQIALVLRAPIVFLLTSGLGVHYLFSNLLSLTVVTLVRFAFADLGIWVAQRGASQVYWYNLPGKVSIASQVALPELELFQTEANCTSPMICVQVGRKGNRDTVEDVSDEFLYDEGLGPFGFWAHIRVGRHIEVRVSPLLRLSPHVLYTNVIEPLLRWLFVTKGYSLVHGACLAFGDEAYLITARTDTGKTTTLLQILARQPDVSFLSDDLTLLAPDGQVLTYPKPLTISAHTVRAVNLHSLSRLEQLTLPFQSRIHSRSGRRLAHWLATFPLPMGTINAIIQWLVPPPKFLIHQLIPSVQQKQTAKLKGIFVIDRAAEAIVPLDADMALTTLMQNGEDAYGFPPYPAMANFLTHLTVNDLRPVELALVANAIANVPTVRISSLTGWWAHILDHVALPA